MIKLPTKNFKRLLPYIGGPLDAHLFVKFFDIKITKLSEIIKVADVENDCDIWAVKAYYTCDKFNGVETWDHFHFDIVSYERDLKLKKILK